MCSSPSSLPSSLPPCLTPDINFPECHSQLEFELGAIFQCYLFETGRHPQALQGREAEGKFGSRSAQTKTNNKMRSEYTSLRAIAAPK